MKNGVSKPQLGQALRRLRRSQQLTQVDVSDRARELGSRLAAEQISKWENGHDWPTVQSLLNYLAAVGRDFCDLQRALNGLQAAESVEREAADPRFRHYPELRALVAELLGESAELAWLRGRIYDLERRVVGGAGRSGREMGV